MKIDKYHFHMKYKSHRKFLSARYMSSCRIIMTRGTVMSLWLAGWRLYRVMWSVWPASICADSHSCCRWLGALCARFLPHRCSSRLCTHPSSPPGLLGSLLCLQSSLALETWGQAVWPEYHTFMQCFGGVFVILWVKVINSLFTTTKCI